jgi:hypothetical protein
MFHKIIEMNNNGTIFPIWATCLGFELIHALVVNMNPDVLSSLDEPDMNLTLRINVTETPGELYKKIPSNLLKYV